MATQIFLGSGGANLPTAETHRGTNSVKLNGVASGWDVHGVAIGTRGLSALALTGTPVAGTTLGIEVLGASGNPVEWISPPLSADVTISGIITGNIWAAETDMNGNVAINFVVDKLDSVDGTITQVVKSARITEVALTTRAVNNFTATPGAGVAFKRGDRIRIRIFGDDAGTMGAAGTFTIGVGGPTIAVDGDTYLTFTETFAFETPPIISSDETGDTYALFGGSGTNEQHAQSFASPATAKTMSMLSLQLAKVGTPTDNLIVEIQADSAGAPSGTALATLATQSCAALTTTQTSYDYTFKPYTLSASTTYWIVLRRDGAADSSNYPAIGGKTSGTFAGGTKAVRTSASWSNNAADLFFRAFFGTPLYLTDTASDVPGEKEARTGRGFGSVDAATVTKDGWISPMQVSRLEVAQTTEDSDGATDEDTDRVAQSFTAFAGDVTGVALLLRRVNSPADNLVVEIQSDSAGIPSGTVLATATISAASLSLTSAVTDVVFASPVTLTASTLYWIVLKRTGATDTTNYVKMRFHTSTAYTGGGAFISSNSGASYVVLTGADADLWFVVRYPAEWYTRPLAAFTLGGICRFNIRAVTSGVSRASVKAEVAVTNGDGTGATVLGVACVFSQSGQLTTSEAAWSASVAVDDTVIAEGQRLRFRLYVDDMENLPLVSGHTVTITYGGTTAVAAGDTFVTLPQTISDSPSFIASLGRRPVPMIQGPDTDRILRLYRDV